MTQPQRIVVVGSFGAGKSTFARRVAAARGIPHIELDAHWHLPGWTMDLALTCEASFAVVGALLLGGCSLFKAASRPAPDLKVTSTPDPETGIGKWIDAQVEAAIRFGSHPSGKQLSPVMPWPFYGGLNAADMKALVA